MEEIIHIRNDGPEIVATSYWQTEHARAGKIWCSINAGAIRVLLPASAATLVSEMRPATYCVLSRGRWPEEQRDEGIEIMWEDGSETPFALHLSPESFDMLPGDPKPGEWIVSVWIQRAGEPVKELELQCKWRRVPKIPWMREWK